VSVSVRVIFEGVASSQDSYSEIQMDLLKTLERELKEAGFILHGVEIQVKPK
jgi:hypothetical protein